MIEQTGSIFLECEYGYYHASIFSEINVRNSKLEICKSNQKGIIQVSSLLPTSYPGHNILTEDLVKLKELIIVNAVEKVNTLKYMVDYLKQK